MRVQSHVEDDIQKIHFYTEALVQRREKDHLAEEKTYNNSHCRRSVCELVSENSPILTTKTYEHSRTQEKRIKIVIRDYKNRSPRHTL